MITDIIISTAIGTLVGLGILWYFLKRNKLHADFNDQLQQLQEAINKHSKSQPLNANQQLTVFQTASRFYLTQSVPNDWYDMEEEEQNEFLTNHAWGAVEHLTPDEIYTYIESACDTIKDMLLELNFISNGTNETTKKDP